MSLSYKALDLSLITHSIHRTSENVLFYHFMCMDVKLTSVFSSKKKKKSNTKGKYMSDKSSIMMVNCTRTHVFKVRDALNAKIHVCDCALCMTHIINPLYLDFHYITDTSIFIRSQRMICRCSFYTTPKYLHIHLFIHSFVHSFIHS